MNEKKVELTIKRQDGPGQKPYWEECSVPYKPDMNVISALTEIQRNPVNTHGKSIRPVVWDCSCLEEVCGACTMIINGTVRQSCSALIDDLDQPIVLEPMTKFPVVRDLFVDRQKMFEALEKTRSWIEIDGTHDLGSGPKVSEHIQEQGYLFSRCMTCGCCCEACPQFNETSRFVGPAAIGQVSLFNMHPTGNLQKAARLDVMMEKGGISDCGNAQNCVRVCPKDIPLLNAIGEVSRQTTVHSLKKLLSS